MKGLGGDSLSGAVVAARIHSALGVELSLGAIADHPTVSTLAAVIDERRTRGAAGGPAITRAPRTESMPLSLFQERIWSIRQRPEDRAGFTLVKLFRILGPLDIDVAKESLVSLINRHEIMRTTFGFVDGSAVQIIHPSAPIDFTFIDLANVTDPYGQAALIYREAAARTIDLERLPIVKHLLIRVAKDDYQLARIFHPLLLDGASWQILNAELATFYEARLKGVEPPLPAEPSLQYADYAVWQRRVMRRDSASFIEVVDWWKGILSAATPKTKLPFTRKFRAAGLDPSAGVLPWKLFGP